MNWKGYGSSRSNLRYYLGICLETLRQIITACQNSWFPGQDLNSGPPKHERVAFTYTRRTLDRNIITYQHQMRSTYHCNNYCQCYIQTSVRILIKYEGTDHCKDNNEDSDEANNYINDSSLKEVTKCIRHRHNRTRPRNTCEDYNLITGFY
jgi:hypothetical protein